MSCGRIIHPGPVFLKWTPERNDLNIFQHLVNVYQRSLGWFIISCCCNWTRKKNEERKTRNIMLIKWTGREKKKATRIKVTDRDWSMTLIRGGCSGRLLWLMKFQFKIVYLFFFSQSFSVMNLPKDSHLKWSNLLGAVFCNVIFYVTFYFLFTFLFLNPPPPKKKNKKIILSLFFSTFIYMKMLPRVRIYPFLFSLCIFSFSIVFFGPHVVIFTFFRF